MTPGVSAPGAHGVRSVEEYGRRLRAAMRLVDAKTRDSVVKEITSGVEAQVQAAGGDFARVAPSLDDPAWVGRQMVKVYGVAMWAKLAALALVALLALASVPGIVAQPPESGAAIVGALLAFAALVAILFAGATRVSTGLAAAGGGLAAALRVVGFLIPQGGMSPLDNATGGELALFLLATALLVLVAVVPALVLRGRGGE